MKDYTQALLRRFPSDERLGFFVKPQLPAKKLGKLLGDYTKINSPGDVVAFYQYSGYFSGFSALFTAYLCHYSKGFFNLEDVKSVEVQKETICVFVNQGGGTTRHDIKTENENAAKLLARVFEEIAYTPKADELIETVRNYEGFSKEAINWLELRDEVMQTIDTLYQKFNDGKLTLLEYEEKKSDLLSRL